MSPSKATNNGNKTVLVIGGGLGGLAAISGLRKLDKDVNIILVEPKDHMELYWATYRSPFEDWVAQGSLVTLKTYCEKNNVKHVQGALVSKLDKNKAFLSVGETLAFDVGVVAVGAASQWPGLGRGPPSVGDCSKSSSSSSASATKQDRLAALKAEGERILNSKSVVIIGGGLIGTELAGDVAGYAAQKGKTDVQVTLVHSKDKLCPEMSVKAAAKVQQKLEKLGVTVLLNEKATQKEDGVLLTKSQKEMQAETVIMTNGFQPVNQFLEHMAGALDEKGWIVTDDYFRVPGSDGHIFAMGDCTTTLPNAGNQYMSNTGIIGQNIKATLDAISSENAVVAVDEKKMKKVSSGFQMFVNTVGPNGGVAYSSAFWTQYLLPWLKNATMFFMSPKQTLGIYE